MTSFSIKYLSFVFSHVKTRQSMRDTRVGKLRLRNSWLIFLEVPSLLLGFQ